jgi:hypothetical protein
MAQVLSDLHTQDVSEYKLAREIRAAMSSQAYEQIRAQMQREIAGGYITTEDELKARAIARMEEEERNIQKLHQGYLISIRAKQHLTRNLSRWSPSSAFTYLGESLINSGFVGQERFEERGRRFGGIYAQYVRAKVGKVVPLPRFFGGMRFQFEGETIIVARPHPSNYEGELTDFPAFPRVSPSLGEMMSDALVEVSSLILWNVLVILGGYVAFIRYDVRPE